MTYLPSGDTSEPCGLFARAQSDQAFLDHRLQRMTAMPLIFGEFSSLVDCLSLFPVDDVKEIDVIGRTARLEWRLAGFDAADISLRAEGIEEGPVSEGLCRRDEILAIGAFGVKELSGSIWPFSPLYFQ